jgi:L-amino acid N-acyltransferase YncA
MSFELKLQTYPDSKGPIRFAPVPWDSDVFGIPVYEARFSAEEPCPADLVAAWLSSLDAGSPCLVCTKVDQQAVPLLEALAINRFYPVEAVLELEGSLAKANTITRAPRVPARLRPATAADLPAFTAIAASAFWSDRFHLDPNLSNDAADQRYVGWIERAFADGDPVFAFEREDGGAVVGFYHVRAVSDERVDLMLAAIDPSLTGLGLGAALYQSMMFECVRMGFKTAQTRIVARNLPVLNIFSRLNYSFSGATMALHRYGSSAEG